MPHAPSHRAGAGLGCSCFLLLPVSCTEQSPGGPVHPCGTASPRHRETLPLPKGQALRGTPTPSTSLVGSAQLSPESSFVPVGDGAAAPKQDEGDQLPSPTTLVETAPSPLMPQFPQSHMALVGVLRPICFIPLHGPCNDRPQAETRPGGPRASSGGRRLQLPLVDILQGSGDGPHVHLNAARPVLHVADLLRETEMSGPCPGLPSAWGDSHPLPMAHRSLQALGASPGGLEDQTPFLGGGGRGGTWSISPEASRGCPRPGCAATGGEGSGSLSPAGAPHS